MTETIREAYIRMNPKSAELYPKFQELFPSGGAGHDGYVASPFPISIARGQGPRKWDVDGNEYIDFGLGSASLLLGHAHPAVVDALTKAAPLGSHFGGPVESMLEWGERVHNLIPCADKVRFVASGAESTMLSMRIARAYTGKEKIIRWESHYHGWHDYAMPGNLPPFDAPASIGIPQGAVDSVIVLPPDLDSLERTLAADNNIAGVITEGSGASYGTVPLSPGFLEGVRRLTRQYNVLMILDEVITGFRWSPGGLQQRIGIDPDLCTLAKILTGGLPGGAVAGRDDIMQVMIQTGDRQHDRHERVLHGGTFNANPYCAATGNAALEIVATGEMQDTADRMAYVGEADPEEAPGLFVATGFNAWGISNGTAAGLGIARQIITGRRPWKTLYDPRRPSPDDFNQSGESQSQVDELDAIGPGEGGVITRGDEQIAVWRDDSGVLHGVSAACTHMGCSVTWNNADRTWDCPCHGSIFQADGEVIHGPAIQPLAARSL